MLIVLVGLGATSMGFLGMFHAAEFVSPGLATVIANVQPIIAAALAHVFLGERLMVIGKIGLAVGLAGIAAIAWPGLAGDASTAMPWVSPTSFSPRPAFP
jgi:drug/metabolite transporter (DMT)-like permease